MTDWHEHGVGHHAVLATFPVFFFLFPLWEQRRSPDRSRRSHQRCFSPAFGRHSGVRVLRGDYWMQKKNKKKEKNNNKRIQERETTGTVFKQTKKQGGGGIGIDIILLFSYARTILRRSDISSGGFMVVVFHVAIAWWKKWSAALEIPRLPPPPFLTSEKC